MPELLGSFDGLPLNEQLFADRLIYGLSVVEVVSAPGAAPVLARRDPRPFLQAPSTSQSRRWWTQ